MSIEIKVPQLPESVADATLVTWHKQVGQAVTRDENLADLETDKVVLEVPAPVTGVLKELRIAAGTSVTSGQVLAVLEEGAAATAAAAAVPAKAAAAPAPAAAKAASAAAANDSGKLAPSVRRMVEEKQLDPSKIPATGRDGRITKGDVVEYLDKPAVAAPGKAATAPAPAATPGVAGRQDQRVPMTRLRARIAERLLEAQHSQAQLTTFNEVDLKAVMDVRAKYRTASKRNTA
jgi:2-oxoglutarate dehydrogenase E2 component (dihydrolipoamide succinyltransferase)